MGLDLHLTHILGTVFAEILEGNRDEYRKELGNITNSFIIAGYVLIQASGQSTVVHCNGGSDQEG